MEEEEKEEEEKDIKFSLGSQICIQIPTLWHLREVNGSWVQQADFCTQNTSYLMCNPYKNDK